MGRRSACLNLLVIKIRIYLDSPVNISFYLFACQMPANSIHVHDKENCVDKAQFHQGTIDRLVSVPSRYIR